VGKTDNTITSVDDAIMKNTERMASDNSTTAATARLNRELVNTMDNWLNAEALRNSETIDVMLASFHGVNTVCGTIAMNLDMDSRKEFLTKAREHMSEMFEEMVEATTKEE